MSTCALCLDPEATGVARVSGLDLCLVCRTADPTQRLQERGVAADFQPTRLRFEASLGLSGQEAGFRLHCVPETWAHQLAKLAFAEMQVGDPVFDKAVYVRTSDPERATRLLGSEGVQSAILTMLTGVRMDDMVGSRVVLDGSTLEISSVPHGGMSEELLQELRLESAVLALHLVALAG